MAELTLDDISTPELKHLVRSQVMLAPTLSVDSGALALSTMRRFPASGAWAPGDSFIVSSDAAFHMIAGPDNVEASVSSPKFPAGVYPFTLPDGCTHVAMIQSAAGAAVGQAYRG